MLNYRGHLRLPISTKCKNMVKTIKLSFIYGLDSQFHKKNVIKHFSHHDHVQYLLLWKVWMRLCKDYRWYGFISHRVLYFVLWWQMSWISDWHKQKHFIERNPRYTLSNFPFILHFVTLKLQVYSIKHYVIKLFSDWRQVGGFLHQ